MQNIQQLYTFKDMDNNFVVLRLVKLGSSNVVALDFISVYGEELPIPHGILVLLIDPFTRESFAIPPQREKGRVFYFNYKHGFSVSMPQQTLIEGDTFPEYIPYHW